jgi:hypothetical protein
MEKTLEDRAFDAAEEILDVENDPDFTAKYKDGFEAGYIAGALAEREACAKLCDDEARKDEGLIYVLAQRLAIAIRARKN